MARLSGIITNSAVQGRCPAPDFNFVVVVSRQVLMRRFKPEFADDMLHDR